MKASKTTTKWFTQVTTEGELKKLWRKLARQHHPDFGGIKEVFQEINNEYQEALKTVYVKSSGYTQSKADWKWSLDEKVMEIVIEVMKKTSNLDIEICGTWIWVTGETRSNRKALKELKFKWSSKKAAWYWREQSYRKKARRELSFDEIRGFYGSEKVEEKESTLM